MAEVSAWSCFVLSILLKRMESTFFALKLITEVCSRCLVLYLPPSPHATCSLGGVGVFFSSMVLRRFRQLQKADGVHRRIAAKPCQVVTHTTSAALSLAKKHVPRKRMQCCILVLLRFVRMLSVFPRLHGKFTIVIAMKHLDISSPEPVHLSCKQIRRIFIHHFKKISPQVLSLGRSASYSLVNLQL